MSTDIYTEWLSYKTPDVRLTPCPFCGKYRDVTVKEEKEDIWGDGSRWWYTWYVECGSCKSRGPSTSVALSLTERGPRGKWKVLAVVDSWNERTFIPGNW